MRAAGEEASFLEGSSPAAIRQNYSLLHVVRNVGRVEPRVFVRVIGFQVSHNLFRACATDGFNPDAATVCFMANKSSYNPVNLASIGSTMWQPISTLTFLELGEYERSTCTVLYPCPFKFIGDCALK